MTNRDYEQARHRHHRFQNEKHRLRNWKPESRYRGSRRFDYSCGNHGSCGYCWSNRMYQYLILELEAKEERRSYLCREN